MRVIVCGSRDFDDADLLSRWLCSVLPVFIDETPVIVHGAARGADRLAAEFARRNHCSEEAHPADWQGTAGRYAGPARNLQMAEAGADLCLAFWDGSSAGTLDMIKQATKHGIPVRIVPWKRP